MKEKPIDWRGFSLRDIDLFSSVDGFVGANLFAHSTGYVRMNSHPQKRHNPLKYQSP